MADPLPLWPIAPNWADPVTERIESLTAVLGGTLGHEQRQALRYRPRRSIEATFTPFESERSFAVLALQRQGAVQWRVPLWFDSTRLTASAASGATALYFDTQNREYRPGDYALLVGPDIFSGERVEVLAVFADHITLNAPTTKAWAAGAQIHPCRPAWIDAGGLGGITNRVASFTARFDIDTDSDFPEGIETAPEYQGLPLLVHRPNWADPVELALEQRFDEFDPGIGPRARRNPAGRAFAMIRYSLLFDGLAEIASFRALLYRLRGKARPVWVPTYGADMMTSAPSLSGQGKIDVRKIGFESFGDITDDVGHVLIGNDEAIELAGFGVALGADQERLDFVTNLTRNVATGERVSLLSLVRLEQDTVVINHVTDSVATSSLAWKAFAGGRNGLAAGVLPIPLTAMNETACGVPPAAPVFPLTITVTTPDPLPLDRPVGPSLTSYGTFRLSFTLDFSIGGNAFDFNVSTRPEDWELFGGTYDPLTGTLIQTVGGITCTVNYSVGPGALVLTLSTTAPVSAVDGGSYGLYVNMEGADMASFAPVAASIGSGGPATATYSFDGSTPPPTQTFIRSRRYQLSEFYP